MCFVIVRTINCTFFLYETLLWFSKPAFINPVLENQKIPLERLLEEEAVGIAFPINATYFDQFPLIFDDGLSDKILVFKESLIVVGLTAHLQLSLH